VSAGRAIPWQAVEAPKQRRLPVALFVEIGRNRQGSSRWRRSSSSS
jgi:hypothetical protein